MTGHRNALERRARQLVEESGLSWTNAWRQAKTELGEDDTPNGGKACAVGCGIAAAWVVGLLLTTVGALTSWAVFAGQTNDIGALSFIFGGFLGLPCLSSLSQAPS